MTFPESFKQHFLDCGILFADIFLSNWKFFKRLLRRGRVDLLVFVYFFSLKQCLSLLVYCAPQANWKFVVRQQDTEVDFKL